MVALGSLRVPQGDGGSSPLCRSASIQSSNEAVTESACWLPSLASFKPVNARLQQTLTGVELYLNLSLDKLHLTVSVKVQLRRFGESSLRQLEMVSSAKVGRGAQQASKAFFCGREMSKTMRILDAMASSRDQHFVICNIGESTPLWSFGSIVWLF